MRGTCAIVVAEDADSIVLRAARELRDHIAQISGATLPLRTANEKSGPREILVGPSARSAALVTESELQALGEDGFIIRCSGNRLAIVGGPRKGTLYGVYSFLEEQLGCRVYSATVRVLPERHTIRIGRVDVRQVPRFTHREVHYLNAMNRGYSEWHKLHSTDDRNESWGMWVHTFQHLVPAEKHFAAHPDWFTLQGGRRIPSGQLCLTHPDVFQVLVDSLRAQIARKPGARYWSVSTNDNYNECRCERCAEANARFGGSAGTLVDFVNRVAAQFPGHDISTLAYQYTRSAPTHIQPAPNVNIMLCSIECNRSAPLDTDPASASFRRDVEDWARLTGNIIMWDYVVQFRNLVSPFPNLRVLQPNIRFFARHGIRMMFQQGAGRNEGEFGELRTYLIAKLLWNPDVNIDSVMNDFLSGYYGSAGPIIRRYIDRMHDALEQSKGALYIFGNPYDAVRSYLTPELIADYGRIFDEAESAVRDSAVLLERVRIARLPLEYAILEISLRGIDPSLSYFDTSGGTWRVSASMRDRLRSFVTVAKRAGIERLEERGTSPDEYLVSIEQQLRLSIEGNRAFGRPVSLLSPHSEKYPVGGGRALTDGRHGPNDFHINWLGFEGEHMDAVVDLGSTQPVRRISTSFLQQWYSWIWLPRRVEFLVSSDGVEYTPLRTVENTVSDEKDGMFATPFTIETPGITARYVRIRAENILRCPDWHIGAGGKAWLFVDEIVVE